jgi:hypothetical protein
VKQPTSRQPLQKIQETGVQPIDLVRGLQPGDAEGSATRATAVWTEMEHVVARIKLLGVAIAALKNRHVTEALEKSPVDTPHPPATVLAL